MTITSLRQKRDLVQALRQKSDWFLNFCNCAGQQPSIENDNSDTHVEGCEYRKRVEREKNEAGN